MRIIRSGIYQWLNKINGKSYIGSSKDLTNRKGHWIANFKKDKMKYKSILHDAAKKHGLENFIFIILEECEPTKEMLEARENYYIETINPEYNILQKAYSPLGFKWTEEQKQEYRNNYSEERKQATAERSKEYMEQPEIKEKYSELRKGKTFEEIFGEERAQEILEKQSIGRTGKAVGLDPWNKGTTGLQEAWNKGIPCSEETKQKIRDSYEYQEPWNKGLPWNDEIKQKISESKIGQEAWNKGIPATEKEKQRLYEMFQANYTEEHQQKMTEAARIVNTGKERSEETKLKISESNRNSDARKTFAESRKWVERTDDVKEKIGKGIRESEIFQNSVKARFGKSNNKGTHGNYGVTWRNDSNRWIVKIHNKKYGSFKTIEEAILRRDEIMVQLNANQN